MASVACKFINLAFVVFFCLIQCFVCCCNMFVFMEATLMFIYLNKFVTFLICGL